METVLFEIKTFIKSKAMIPIIVLAVVIPSLLFSYTYIFGEEAIRVKLLEESGKYSIELEERISGMENAMKQGRYRKTGQRYIAYCNDMLDLISQIDYAHDENKNIAEARLAFNKKYFEYKDYPYEDYNGKKLVTEFIPEDVARSNLEKLEKMVELGIEYQDSDYSLAFFNFLYRLYELSFPIIQPLLLSFLLLSLVKFDRKGQDRIKNLMPVSKISKYLSKVLAAFFVLLIYIFIMGLTSLILCIVFGNGLGSVKYPVVSRIVGLYSESLIDKGYFWSITSIEIVLLKMLLVFLLNMFVVISFEMLISSVLRLDLLVNIVTFISLSLVSSLPNNLGEKIGLMGIKASDKILINLPFYNRLFTKMPEQVRYGMFSLLVTGITIAGILFLLSAFLDQKDLGLKFKEKNIQPYLKKIEKSKLRAFPSFEIEMKKCFKKIDIVIAILISISSLLVFSYHMDSKYQETKEAYTDYYQRQMISAIEAINNSKDYEGDYKVNNAHLLSKISEYQKFLDGYENNDQFKIVDSLVYSIHESVDPSLGYTPAAKVFRTYYLNEIAKTGSSVPISSDYKSPFNLYNNLANKIISIFTKQDYQKSSNFIINAYLKGPIFALCFLGILYALGSGFSGDVRGGRNIDLHNTQPIKSKNIYLGKLVSNSLIFIGSILFIFVFVIGVHLIESRDKDMNLVSTVYKENKEAKTDIGFKKDDLGALKGKNEKGSFYVSTRKTWQESIDMIWLSLGLAVFSLALICLFSLYTRSRLTNIGIFIFINLIFYLLAYHLLGKFAFLFASSYFNLGDSASRLSSIITGSSYMKTRFGIIVLLVSSLIITVLGIFSYKKMFRRA